MNKTKRIVLTILGVVGFLTSIKLAMIYIDANFNPYALPSFCSINEFVDCDSVAKTVHSQFFGIPLAFWGLFLYFVFLFFTYVDKLKNIRFLKFLEVFKSPESYICALGIIAFLISMILAFISIFEIQKICVLCFFTYVLNLLIGFVAKPKEESIVSVFVTSFKDFISALKVKKYAIAFALLAAAAIGFLTYTTVSNVLAPQLKIQKEHKYYLSGKNEYRISGNILGEKDAGLVVHSYTDYKCPFCFVLNTMLHRAASELRNIKIVHHNLPLDNACNKNIKRQMHEGACLLSQYSIAAGYQNKYWDMNSILFDNDYNNEDEILSAAKKIGLDTEKLKNDAHSQKVADALQKEIDDATLLGIDATPALRINMKTEIGVMPYEELKALLIKAGAKERK